MDGTPVETLERPATEEQAEPEPEVILAELLVEEVSIDGMCGVY